MSSGLPSMGRPDFSYSYSYYTSSSASDSNTSDSEQQNTTHGSSSTRQQRPTSSRHRRRRSSSSSAAGGAGGGGGARETRTRPAGSTRQSLAGIPASSQEFAGVSNTNNGSNSSMSGARGRTRPLSGATRSTPSRSFTAGGGGSGVGVSGGVGVSSSVGGVGGGGSAVSDSGGGLRTSGSSGRMGGRGRGRGRGRGSRRGRGGMSGGGSQQSLSGSRPSNSSLRGGVGARSNESASGLASGSPANSSTRGGGATRGGDTSGDTRTAAAANSSTPSRSSAPRSSLKGANTDKTVDVPKTTRTVSFAGTLSGSGSTSGGGGAGVGGRNRGDGSVSGSDSDVASTSFTTITPIKSWGGDGGGSSGGGGGGSGSVPRGTSTSVSMVGSPTGGSSSASHSPTGSRELRKRPVSGGWLASPSSEGGDGGGVSDGDGVGAVRSFSADPSDYDTDTYADNNDERRGSGSGSVDGRGTEPGSGDGGDSGGGGGGGWLGWFGRRGQSSAVPASNATNNDLPATPKPIEKHSVRGRSTPSRAVAVSPAKRRQRHQQHLDFPVAIWFWALVDQLQFIALTGGVAVDGSYDYVVYTATFAWANLWANVFSFGGNEPLPDAGVGLPRLGRALRLQPSAVFPSTLANAAFAAGVTAVAFAVWVTVALAVHGVSFSDALSSRTSKSALGEWAVMVALRFGLLLLTPLSCSLAFQFSVGGSVGLLVCASLVLIGILVFVGYTVSVVRNVDHAPEDEELPSFRALGAVFEHYTDGAAWASILLTALQIMTALVIGVAQGPEASVAAVVVAAVLCAARGAFVAGYRPFVANSDNWREVGVAVSRVCTLAFLGGLAPGSGASYMSGARNALCWLAVSFSLTTALFLAAVTAVLAFVWFSQPGRSWVAHPTTPAARATGTAKPRGIVKSPVKKARPATASASAGADNDAVEEIGVTPLPDLFHPIMGFSGHHRPAPKVAAVNSADTVDSGSATNGVAPLATVSGGVDGGTPAPVGGMGAQKQAWSFGMASNGPTNGTASGISNNSTNNNSANNSANNNNSGMAVETVEDVGESGDEEEEGKERPRTATTTRVTSSGRLARARLGKGDRGGGSGSSADGEASSLSQRRKVPSLAVSIVAREDNTGDGDPFYSTETEREMNDVRRCRGIMSAVTDYLFVGGVEVASDKDLLRSNNVTHIINAAGETAEPAFPGEFDYTVFYLRDHNNEDITSVLYTALAVVADARRGGGSVLIHCMQGISRSATLAAAHLMYEYDYTFETAFDKVKAARSVCSPNTGFMVQLMRWHARRHSPLDEPLLYRVAPHHATKAPSLLVLKAVEEPAVGGVVFLDPRTTYVLHSPRPVPTYVWTGSVCPPAYAEAALAGASVLVKEEHASPTIRHVAAGGEAGRFFRHAFSALPGVRGDVDTMAVTIGVLTEHNDDYGPPPPGLSGPVTVDYVRENSPNSSYRGRDSPDSPSDSLPRPVTSPVRVGPGSQAATFGVAPADAAAVPINYAYDNNGGGGYGDGGMGGGGGGGGGGMEGVETRQRPFTAAPRAAMAEPPPTARRGPTGPSF